jgi:hypothetical protein
VGPFAVAIRVYRVRQADKQERIAVRRCPHDGFGADIAECLQILASAGNESAAGEFLSLQAEASDLVPFFEWNAQREGFDLGNGHCPFSRRNAMIRPPGLALHSGV